jgi:chemotaxis-related protein WspD
MSLANSLSVTVEASGELTEVVAEDKSLLNDCWNRVGVFGDRTCQELLQSVHCRNCQVYSAAGRSLLERLPPGDYLQEWTAVLAETKRGAESSTLSADGTVVRSDQSLSVMIFRLSSELFALPVGVFLEVSSPFVVHSVPRRSNTLFLGMVNIRGEIMLAASLTTLLGLATTRTSGSSHQGVGRMAVAGTPEGKWVFPIDEIYGIYLFNRDDVKSPSVVISHADESYTRGVFQWQNRSVALLDPDRIFSALTTEISPK